jgi:ribosomal protein L32E
VMKVEMEVEVRMKLRCRDEVSRSKLRRTQRWRWSQTSDPEFNRKPKSDPNDSRSDIQGARKQAKS